MTSPERATAHSITPLDKLNALAQQTPAHARFAFRYS